jgi:outer membrane protein assembly factor BamB
LKQEKESKETLVNKNFCLVIFFIFLIGCSIDNKSGIWSKNKKIKSANQYKDIIFEDNKELSQELNKNIKIYLKDKYTLNNKKNYYNNNTGIKNYDGNLKQIKKIKFSKIKNFSKFKPDILYSKNGNIYFFNSKGTVIKFSKNLDVIWEKNIYSKKEKKLNPLLNLAIEKNTLILTDNLSNYYALNILNGDLLWRKTNSAAFNSEIKIAENKIFTVDYDNILKCFSIENGNLLWEYQTENTLIKSTKKTSLVLNENKVIFLNHTGDLNTLDQNGNLIWQTPTSKSIIYEDSFTNIYSDIVLDNNTIYFSNNKNEFFAVSLDTGSVKWRKKINSSIRPTITKDLIITIADNGFLIILDKKNGKLVRSTNIKTKIKNKKWDDLVNNGFLVGKNKIYLSTNGKLNIIDLSDGLSKKIVDLDKKFIARPYIYEKSMYILSNNQIIKYN